MKWAVLILLTLIVKLIYGQPDTLLKKCDTLSRSYQNKIEKEKRFYPGTCKKRSYKKTKGRWRVFKSHYKEWDESGDLKSHYRSRTTSTQNGALTHRKTRTWKFRENGKICLKKEYTQTTMIRKPWTKH